MSKPLPTDYDLERAGEVYQLPEWARFVVVKGHIDPRLPEFTVNIKSVESPPHAEWTLLIVSFGFPSARRGSLYWWTEELMLYGGRDCWWRLLQYIKTWFISRRWMYR